VSDSLLQGVRDVAASTFNVPVESLSETSGPGHPEEWDSMGQLNLILALEQEYGIEIPPEITESMTDVRTIVTLLRPLVEKTTR
jgi:acyl carrier protein